MKIVIDIATLSHIKVPDDAIECPVCGEFFSPKSTTICTPCNQMSNKEKQIMKAHVKKIKDSKNYQYKYNENL